LKLEIVLEDHLLLRTWVQTVSGHFGSGSEVSHL